MPTSTKVLRGQLRAAISFCCSFLSTHVLGSLLARYDAPSPPPATPLPPPSAVPTQARLRLRQSAVPVVRAIDASSCSCPALEPFRDECVLKQGILCAVLVNVEASVFSIPVFVKCCSMARIK